MTNRLGKLGIFGLFITVLFSPCCFPIFAFFASAIGLGSFEIWGGWTIKMFQVFIVISLLGLFLSYRSHRWIIPLTIAIPSGLAMTLTFYFWTPPWSLYIIYIGMTGFLVSTILNNKKTKCSENCDNAKKQFCPTVSLYSNITCPHCGHQKKETMPTNACVYRYDCEKCLSVLKPIPGDCCVYCSYGSVPCPPIQLSGQCC